MNIVHPKDPEQFHLKLALDVITGETEHKHLRTSKGKLYDTYREAAIAMRLVEHDSHLFDIFDEVCNYLIASQLRKFIAWFPISKKIPGNLLGKNIKNFFPMI